MSTLYVHIPIYKVHVWASKTSWMHAQVGISTFCAVTATNLNLFNDRVAQKEVLPFWESSEFPLKITSESLKDLMCLGTTWYQLESCRGHGSCLTLYYDCKTC